MIYMHPGKVKNILVSFWRAFLFEVESFQQSEFTQDSKDKLGSKDKSRKRSQSRNKTYFSMVTNHFSFHCFLSGQGSGPRIIL